jgi:diguanylate cyclase (GGDEF)-like protein
VLKAVADLVRCQTTADELAARYTGHQFAIVIPDKTPRQCSQKIEQIRQQIEQTSLVGAADPSQVTVSCALIAAAADDTFDTLFTRLEETTLEAKRYGRNRTFIHEGKYPAPLAPPQLDIAPAHVEI